MTLADLMASHAAGELTRDDMIGEAATYHFISGAADRAVRVVVDRQALDAAGGNPRDSATIQTAVVFLPNSATVGVSSITAGDEITVVLRVGATATRCRIREQIDGDAGGFLVHVVA